MSPFAEINLEYGMPPVADAMVNLKNSLHLNRRLGCKCLLIIHGYGSTGKGGVIRQKSRQWLMAQKRNGTVRNVIFGEDFNIFNFDALNLKNRFRKLEPLLHVCNCGVTVVEL